MKFLRAITLIVLPAVVTAQLRFSSVDSAIAFGLRNGYQDRIGSEQKKLARATTNAAMANVVNFRNPVSFSATDNLLLPVNFIPADAFGGPPGSYRQITLGQEYVSNFNFSPQVDLINPQTWTRVKSARINEEITGLGNAMSRKTTSEAIAAAYFNIASLSEQEVYLTRGVNALDSIVIILENRFREGLVRSQDLNNAKVMAVSLRDRITQLIAAREQQEANFKALCNIPVENQLQIEAGETNELPSLTATGSLTERLSRAQARMASQELSVLRASMLPVVSLVYYQGWQKNSNVSFTDANAPWIQSKYFGLRISVPIPPDVTRWSQSYNQKVNARIAAMNYAQAAIQSQAANRVLEIDARKGDAGYRAAAEIYALRKENFSRSSAQFQEGIIPPDILLTAFADLMNAASAAAAAKGQMHMQHARLNINNQFK